MTKQDVIENVKNHVNGDRQDVLINYYNEQPREFFLNYVKSDLAQDMTRDLKRIDAIREHNTDVLDAALKNRSRLLKIQRLQTKAITQRNIFLYYAGQEPMY